MTAAYPPRPDCRILHLEDSTLDGELVAAHLSRAGIGATLDRVDTRAAFAAALESGGHDLILADYVLPGFDGLAALAMARVAAPAIPFVFVSGTLGEEAAVEALKQGATDYVVKQRLGRLPVVVHRALAEARAHEERKQALAALEESELRYRLTVESARDYAIFTTDLSGIVTGWNTGAQRILGYGAEEVLGRSAALVLTPEDRAADRLDEEMRLALRDGRGDDERWHLRKDGSRFWASGLTMPLRDGAGSLRGFLKILRDRSEQRRAEEHRALLIAELNHRVKNTLATVQSLARQTLRATPSPAAFVAAFQGRLRTLARAHDLLTRENWEGVTLEGVARAALAPWLDSAWAGRVRLGGPGLRLAPQQALAISMALHELATNAVKHGALSVPPGHVAVTWERDATAASLDWVEADGPPVRVPERRGFGSRLLGRPLATELGGGVELVFDPAGVRCRFRLPILPVEGRTVVPTEAGP